MNIMVVSPDGGRTEKEMYMTKQDSILYDQLDENPVTDILWVTDIPCAESEGNTRVCFTKIE
jgi:hypothetical protein